MGTRGSRERQRSLARVVRVVVLLLVIGFTVAIPSALAVHDDGLFELDGNAVEEAAAGADWSTAVNGGTPNQISRVFISDAFDTTSDDIFTGGNSKDDHDIPDWRWTTGSAPDKDDLEHAYAAGYTASNGDLIVYFGADRFATSGDSNLGFWFTKNGITPNPDGTFSGSHADGDLFVVSEFTQGGATPVISVYKWVGGGLTQVATSTGCTADDGACAVVNSAAAAAPWPYTPKSGSAGTFPTGAFFEGGVDLTTLFGGNDNLPCVHSFLAETRSSDSLNAVLKDFASGSFNLCAEIITDKVTNPSGSSQSFDFSTTGPSGFSQSFSLTDAATPHSSGQVKPGTYSTSETVPAGWGQTGASCSDGSPVNAIAVGPGESVTCTFNNARQPRLTVIKHVVNDNGGTAVASNWSMHVTSSGSDVSGSPFAGSESSGTTLSLNAGSYNVSETSGPGNYAASFSGSCDSNGNVTLVLGQDATCTVTNNDVGAHLIVIKHVVNDNGGTMSASDFTMTINGVAAVGGNSFPGAESPGTDKTLTTVGSYSVTETTLPGYAASSSTDCTGTIALGETKTCTIVNNDAAPTLKVIKHVVNDNGGTAVASAWSMHIKSGGSDVSGSPFAGSEAGTTKTVSAGTLVVSESGGPSGYAVSFSGDCDANGNVTLSPGENKTCTVTNDDIAPTLTVIKHVVNDNGGSAVASAWSMHIKSGGSDISGSPFPGAESPGTTKTVAAGSYLVSESDGPSGYAATISGDCSASGAITLSPGASKTCTITNDDVAGTLTVIKHVVNDDGGSAVASAWSMHIKSGGSDVSGSPFPGAESPGTSKTLLPGAYVVSESDGPSGYAATISGDCSESGAVTLALGENKTCTITNDDVAAMLTVIKHVVNDSGGTAVASDWSMHIKSGGSDVSGSPFPGGESPGTSRGVDPGTYDVSESGGPSGYSASFSGDCDANGNVTIALGQSKTCTVTNDDVAPYLTVIKHVVNDNGGTAVASDWSMHITSGGTDVSGSPFPGAESPGSTKTVNAGTLVVSESDGPSGYAASFSGDCNSSGSVTLGPGETKTCTITNNDQAAHLLVKKHVVNDNGGTSIASDFTLGLSGQSPSPASFKGSEAGVSVTLDAGAYNVTEGDHIGYSVSFSPDCVGTIALGQEKTCTVTNDDQAAHLLVKKHVINDNGGTANASSFNLTVAGQSPSPASFAGDESGISVALNAGAYSVSEGAHAGYTVSFSAECAGSIAVGETKTCTVTNNDIASPPPPPPPSGPPLIDLAITKTDNPDPVQVGAQLTYTLTVTNKKGDTANGVVVTDSLPSDVTLISVTATKGTCSGTTAITCQIGTVAYNEVVVITIVVRPNVVGTITNTAVVAGREPEHNPADNMATEPTLVQGAFVPPSVCYGLTATPRSLMVGHRTIVRVTVREAGKPVAGVQVVISGRGMTKRARTSKVGVARFVITAGRPGILQIRVPTHATCNRQRIGVLGVFTPPVTG